MYQGGNPSLEKNKMKASRVIPDAIHLIFYNRAEEILSICPSKYLAIKVFFFRPVIEKTSSQIKKHSQKTNSNRKSLLMLNMTALIDIYNFINQQPTIKMLNMTARTSSDNPFHFQSSTDIYPRKNRLLASTGFSQLNSSMHMPRLPQLSRSFSSSKSAKLKMTTLEASLSSIQQQLHQLKMDTRESRRFCNFLKDDLGENQLGMLNLKLKEQANKLDKTFKLAKKYDEDRSKALKKDCDALQSSSKNLKAMASTLQFKIDQLQNIMGVYSGKQKHKV